ncbi:MAG TPA: DUF58 domain-containing protein [Puia sp.]|jgi:uncharacterized protein (DUF58 family)
MSLVNYDISLPARPGEVIVTLEDLMRFEWLVRSHRLLPVHPVYSILAGRQSSKLRGRGLDFEEVRRYVPGDDVRNIDWRVTARTGETYSKLFNEEKERPTFIVLDQTNGMFFGTRRFMKSVSAAHTAAIGAFYTLKRGDRVGGIVFGDDGQEQFVPRRDRQAVQFFLESVVRRNGRLPERNVVKPNTVVLNDVLKQTAALTPHDHVVTLISDFSQIDDRTRELLKSISNHNDVILVHVYDPFEESLPDGRLVLSDGKRQLLWNNHRRNNGEAWRRGFAEWRSRFTEEFRHTRIPVVFFNTAEPVEDQISKDLGKINDNKWTNNTDN